MIGGIQMRFLILVLFLGTADANIACGVPPIAPVGCVVGPCVCDEDGNDCHYEMICR